MIPERIGVAMMIAVSAAAGYAVMRSGRSGFVAVWSSVIVFGLCLVDFAVFILASRFAGIEQREWLPLAAAISVAGLIAVSNLAMTRTEK